MPRKSRDFNIPTWQHRSNEPSEPVKENIRLLIYRRLFWHMYEEDKKSINDIHAWIMNHRTEFQIKYTTDRHYCFEPHRTRISVTEETACRRCILKGYLFDKHCFANGLFQLYRDEKGSKIAALWFIDKLEQALKDKGCAEGLEEFLATNRRWEEELAQYGIKNFIKYRKMLLDPKSFEEGARLKPIERSLINKIIGARKKEVKKKVKKKQNRRIDIPCISPMEWKGRKVIRHGQEKKKSN